MTYSTCTTCGHTHSWEWTDAFDKFGFADGDGLVMTETVADFLRNSGYAVTTETWGCHNVVITSIKRRGKQLIPDGATVGYADPRAYLPKRIVTLLDRHFFDREVQP